jgi:murein DD-endopeptidase MepM/ murein hydrolase activator NlpD
MKKGGWILGTVLLLVFSGALGWFLTTIGETASPLIAIEGDPAVVGRQKPITAVFSDSGRGLRHTEVAIHQGNQTHTLSAIDYPQSGTREKRVTLSLDNPALKLQDGPAKLIFTALDHSLWKNRVIVTRPIQIDLLPPQIFQLNANHYLSAGGAGVLTYRLSEPAAVTGVQVGDHLFPAYRANLSGREGYVAYFALPIDAVPGTPAIRILARDLADNETIQDVRASVKRRPFRSDRMSISDTFLARKMPEFQAAIPALRGKTPLDTFLYVNGQLREENRQAIASIASKTEPRQLWDGPFLRMKNAAPMALFGDHRTYYHGGKSIGESIHNGVDLASLAQAPIEAANSGIVSFAGDMGIYGNTVIIDHGLGLATLYAHLSTLQVKAGHSVSKGEVIGASGLTGLAGGDHLHFSVAIHGHFVEPREWWDPQWIVHNVTLKLAGGA